MTEIKNKTEEQVREILAKRRAEPFSEQVAGAFNAIREMAGIDSTLAFGNVSGQIHNSSTARWLTLVTRIAATLFIPLLIASLWLLFRQPGTFESAYAVQHVSSPPGIRSQIVLPDGSKAWLNAGSSLKFRVPFDKECRNVYLEGEAFFDVEHNERLPFVVKAGKLQVTVLGTEFNVKAYGDEPNIDVVVKSGRVMLKADSLQRNPGVELVQGTRAVVDRQTLKATIGPDRIEKYIGWQTGKLTLDETPMPEVAVLLERWYGIDVEVTDQEVRRYRITTTFDNEPLHQVLELLALSSPIKIRYMPAKVNSDNSLQTRSKVIISKKT